MSNVCIIQVPDNKKDKGTYAEDVKKSRIPPVIEVTKSSESRWSETVAAAAAAAAAASSSSSSSRRDPETQFGHFLCNRPNLRQS